MSAGFSRKLSLPRVRVVDVVEVVRVVYYEGEGTPDSLGRLVTTYWSKEGDLLAKQDPVDEPHTS